MTKVIALDSVHILNLANAYTYTVTSADKSAYTSFALEVGGTATLTDGVNSITLTVAANEEVRVNNTLTTIISNAVANKLYFLY